MAIHDLKFAQGTQGNINMSSIGIWPYYMHAGIGPQGVGNQAIGFQGSYNNVSLEGNIHDDIGGIQGAQGYSLTLQGAQYRPKFRFLGTDASQGQQFAISSIQRGPAGGQAANTVLVVATQGAQADAGGVSVGDLVKINGVQFDATHENLNGVFRVATVQTGSVQNYFTYTYSGNQVNPIANQGTAKKLITAQYSVFDDRIALDATGNSFISSIFTPKPIWAVSAQTRILPSDFYTRFKIVDSAYAGGNAGGLNSNIFSVVDSSGLNIKPVIWAYFFGGYPTSGTIARAPNNIFDIVFNSHAIVLRPSGSGSYLEFTLLKFKWGEITSANWFTTYVDSPFFSKYTVNTVDLGYLINTNTLSAIPSGGTTPVIEEISSSSPFLYDSNEPLKLNIKIAIRKHFLSDSVLDNTYLVNLLINDSYDDFSTETTRYSSILHGYITKPIAKSLVTDNDQTNQNNYRLMPYVYFKYVNLNETSIGAQASRFIFDNIVFNQLNSGNQSVY